MDYISDLVDVISACQVVSSLRQKGSMAAYVGPGNLLKMFLDSSRGMIA